MFDQAFLGMVRVVYLGQTSNPPLVFPPLPPAPFTAYKTKATSNAYPTPNGFDKLIEYLRRAEKNGDVVAQSYYEHLIEKYLAARRAALAPPRVRPHRKLMPPLMNTPLRPGIPDEPYSPPPPPPPPKTRFSPRNIPEGAYLPKTPTGFNWPSAVPISSEAQRRATAYQPPRIPTLPFGGSFWGGGATYS